MLVFCEGFKGVMKCACLSTLPLLMGLGLLVSLPWLFALTQNSAFYGIEVNRAAPELTTPSGNLLVGDHQASLVFLGYSGCSAACPAQFVNMQRLNDRLEGRGIRFVFVTLAPERVTKGELETWMASLGPDFTAFSPESASEAQALARGFGGVSQNSIAVDKPAFNHTAKLHLVTSDGIRRLVYPSPALELDRVLQDLELIMDGIEES